MLTISRRRDPCHPGYRPRSLPGEFKPIIWILDDVSAGRRPRLLSSCFKRRLFNPSIAPGDQEEGLIAFAETEAGIPTQTNRCAVGRMRGKPTREALTGYSSVKYYS
jgi:hypothetical protein